MHSDPGSLVGPQLPGVTGINPTWTPERTGSQFYGATVNRQGLGPSGDGGQYLREQQVVNPRGEMVQTWERTQGEEASVYRRSQTQTAPDGTLLRQHEWSRSGTDPYNSTRQRQITLPDGRTMTHTQTRTGDATGGTMERTFEGPNGQSRQFQHAWGAEGQGPPAPPKKSKWSWAEKLNPFRKGGPFRREAPSTTPRSGTSARLSGSSSKWHWPWLSKKESAEPSQSSAPPSWAGQPDSTPAYRSPTASQPGLGYGRTQW